jgi:hypothetical protein
MTAIVESLDLTEFEREFGDNWTLRLMGIRRSYVSEGITIPAPEFRDHVIEWVAPYKVTLRSHTIYCDNEPVRSFRWPDPISFRSGDSMSLVLSLSW